MNLCANDSADSSDGVSVSCETYPRPPLCFIVPCGEFRSPYLGKVQKPQEQRYPFLPMCAVFSSFQTMVYGCRCLGCYFNVHTAVDACDCTRGLH